MSGEASRPSQAEHGLLRSPQDFAAGLFLIALAATAWFAGWTLDMGTLSKIGSGMLPKAVAAMIAAIGVALIVPAFAAPGRALEAWSLRGIFFVLGSALLFAVTVRPLGLVIAGPLVVIFSSLADPDNKIGQTLIFAVVMTMFCGLLFKEALNLPIPFDPQGAVSLLHGPYAGFKSALKGLFLSLIGRG